jgi:hypothetical protein
LILPFFNSTSWLEIQAAVTFLSVFVARFRPDCSASSKLFFEDALSSVILATDMLTSIIVGVDPLPRRAATTAAADDTSADLQPQARGTPVDDQRQQHAPRRAPDRLDIPGSLVGARDVRRGPDRR